MASRAESCSSDIVVKPQQQIIHSPADRARQYSSSHRHKATPVVTKSIQDHPALPQSFFARPAEVVAPVLIGCPLVHRQPNGVFLKVVIVETEAYCQFEPACHGQRRRSPSNETLFGEPGRFDVVVSYGIHHCVKRAVSVLCAGWS